MPRMLKEIKDTPVPGLLGAQTLVSGRTVLTVQYSRSIFHETYVVPRTAVERGTAATRMGQQEPEFEVSSG